MAEETLIASWPGAEENRRILAIDDDEHLLLQYQQIFSGAKRVGSSTTRLKEILSDGVERER